jgi:hypothetical protein
VRIGSDQVVDDLAATAFDFDVLTRSQRVLLDFLEQAAAPAAPDLDPPNAGRRSGMTWRAGACVLQVQHHQMRERSRKA